MLLPLLLLLLLLQAAVGREPAWYNVLPIAAVGFASRKLGLSKVPTFKRYEDVLTLFKPPMDNQPLDDNAAGSINSVTAVKEMGLVQASAKGRSFRQQQEAGKQDRKAGFGGINTPSGGLGDIARRALSTLFKDAQEGTSNLLDINSLLAYPEPKVLAGREGVWATDLEFGRQVLAGMNPCMLAALKEMPADMGSAITAQHVNDDLKQLDPQGRGMAELVAAAAAGEKPRLFIIDYWGLECFWGDAPDAKDRCEHVGRCLMYLQQKDGRDSGLLPIAIELANRKTINGSQGVVYSRAALAGAGGRQEVLWRLAKAVFRSVDCGFHQLVSHWLRCHACTEPFFIALRRNMSSLHPVTKLMLPHFRYTLNINCNARESLINEGGTIEAAFTPGAYAMRLSSAAYKSWRFKQQALPTELAARGMMGPEGQLWLDDYPYAQDGLDLWAAFLDYFTAYLKLYYSSNEEVVADEELQAWWAECKEKGHVDVTDALAEQLVAGGLDAATAATAAEQEYDYSSLLLNCSSSVRRAIPQPDAEDDPAHKALVGKSGDAQEGELLSYLADFKSALQVMTTVKLLSSHADDEHTLNEPNAMLTDAAAVALNASFINTMEALEMRFFNRNRDPANWTRVRGRDEALEYTLLYPSSKPGVTMRGVPYSVSI
ncbi:lipoxygenase [Scenedesmus sp. NREL 46B-D3]|nr:lipoxygenase [Scenedesmus sp. NREL 46B-D3]